MNGFKPYVRNRRDQKGHPLFAFTDRRMSSADKRLLVRGQEEHDAQDIDDAQKHEPSKCEVEEKIDEFIHVELHVRG